MSVDKAGNNFYHRNAMARPPKDPRLLMIVPLRIMLTGEQRDLVGKAAAAYGGDVSAWARPILLRAAEAALAKATKARHRRR